MSSSGQGYAGQIGLSASNSDYTATLAIFMQLLAKVRTATIVRVESCTVNNAVGPIGFVDATPLIGAIDGLGVVYPHQVIHSLAYMRVQGGVNAVIMDPQPGDIGLAVISDRDMSVVRATGAASPPGSRRRFDLTDGVYCFPILSGNGAAPQQYWQFTATGMNATDINGNTIVMSSSGIAINGVLFDRTQHITQVAQVTATGGHTLTQHTHGGVTTGAGTTATPTG